MPSIENHLRQRKYRMRPTTVIFQAMLAATVFCATGVAPAADTALSLVINPRTGLASLRNDTATSVDIDGYLLTSDSAVFNPGGWNSFTADGVPNWALGPEETNRLGEANLFSSRSVGGGASIAIGSPYLPFSATEIGQLEPALNFEYHIAGGDSVMGDVVFAPQNSVVLLVDPATGNASLQNQSNFDVNIDGLLITSPTGVLDAVGWIGMAESGVAGWTSGAAAANRLGEGNLLGSTFLPNNGTPISIGKPINGAMIADETDLVFEYHVADGGSIIGGVEFVAAAVTPLVGDYNGNGRVDAADYTVWRNTLGSTTDLRANGDNTGMSQGKIDEADYLAWKSNFGAGGNGAGGAAIVLNSPATTIPEPSSLLIGCVLGIALLSGCAARRGTH
jgi:hypothetical protein